MEKDSEKFKRNKEFSENLSHELLTPLSIIRSKAELLLQSENLSESDLKNIDSILKTVSKLSKVNRGLILLSKIENNQFVDREKIDIDEIVRDALELMEDQIRHLDLSVRIEKKEESELTSNSNLVHILFNNLIKNACVHNIPGGYVKVVFEKNSISIENSGKANQINEKDIFKRFSSGSNKPDSIGLGLSIVKNICKKLHFKISYKNDKEIHRFTISL